MTKQRNIIAVLGGTFDPIHKGHVQIAEEIYSHLPCHEIRFIPCKIPLLKAAPNATVEQRLEMLNIALSDRSHVVIDTRELERKTPSYMVETLKSLRDDFPSQPLALILGMDAFALLPKWHDWQSLMGLCHIVVLNRPGYNIDECLNPWIQEHQVTNYLHLNEQPAGLIYFHMMPPIDISSTEIRNEIEHGDLPATYLPDKIFEYVRKHRLYR